jgi:hypothetical protein
MKILFFSAVGNASHHLMEPIFKVMSEHDVDIMLGAYDTAYTAPASGRITMHRAEGMSKWQMAKRFLSPAVTEKYSHVFIWDDDLLIGAFDPIRFCSIMDLNHLDAAQPGIRSRFRVSHEITLARDPGKQTSCGATVVGRYTNFVEIMAPVFTGSFWQKVSSYMDDSNPEGLGYDYIPIGTKGIIDCMTIEHTRPVRRKPITLYRNRNQFFEKNGFGIYPQIELGKLTYPETPSTDS